MTDKELIQLCKKRDRKGQKLLYQKLSIAMNRLCLRYMKDQDLTYEVLTTGFLQIFNNIKKFEYRGDGSLEAWARKIMINECLQYLRRENRLLMHVTMDENIATQDPGHEYDSEFLFATIQRLPDGYRTVFNLFAIEGYSHKEISGMLGITESASRSQLTHARKKLQEWLSPIIKKNNG